MTRVVIVAAGDIKDPGWLRRLVGPGDVLLCADGGADHALAAGLLPEVVVGDLDSLSTGGHERLTASGVQLVTVPREKDLTDLQIALEYAAELGAEQVVLAGVAGTDRPDHFLANMGLLVRAHTLGMDAAVEGEGWRASLCHGTRVIEGSPGDTVSLLPLTPTVEGVTLEGFRYPLIDGALEMGDTLGISNQLAEEQGRIRVGEGLLLVVQFERALGGGD